jgi:adenosylcobyric acid synthase
MATSARIEGYEIHMGQTSGPDCAHGWIDLGAGPEGASTAEGRVQGCYLHGLFAADAFRAAWLAQFGRRAQIRYSDRVEETLDALAEHLEKHLDIDRILQLSAEISQRA